MSKSHGSGVASAIEGGEDLEWSPEQEIQLMFALEGLKPVGVNKYFYMACIADRLSRSLKRDVSAAMIWSHLRTMYNLELLDLSEPLPFPNDELEFALPEAEFAPILAKRFNENEEKNSATDAVPSIIALATDNTNTLKDKLPIPIAKATANQSLKDLDKKLIIKVEAPPKRLPPKRTRGANPESGSPSTTPPPLPSFKRRRI